MIRLILLFCRVHLGLGDSRRRERMQGLKRMLTTKLYSMRYCDYLCNKDYPKYAHAFPQMVLVDGCLGVGKSKLRDAICEASETVGSYCLKTAFDAINATEMGGCTTLSLIYALPEIHMRQFTTISNEVFKELKGKGFGPDSCILLDECSTQASWHVVLYLLYCIHNVLHLR